ncbi:MAG: acylphosphatase [Gammaproteobacteria bacterium]|jgi:acylphosphatase
MQGNKICIHCYVTGRVQGVWYRSSAQKEAQKLGVTGWAKNLSDGRVEIMVCGESESVKKFVKWLWKGPMLANVTDIDSEQVSWEDYAEFETL